jgi:hypothetical protein
MAPFTSFRVTRSWGVCVLSVLSVSLLSAQARPATVTASGQVVLPHASDTTPVPGAQVLLHRVGREVQGPIDSVRADAAGRFRFRFQPDTSSLYLLSSRYGGIEYFSPPVHTNPERPDTGIRLMVYDTSSRAPIAVEARHIVVPRAGTDGTRSVLELIVLRNDGILARVAPDSAHPSWAMTLPAGAGGIEVGESDLSPDAVVREGDTVKVLAPLAPGQKQLSLEYPVAPTRGRIEFAVGPSGQPVNVLVEERDVRVSGGTLALADTQVIQGRNFRRWTGEVPAGGIVRISVGGGGGTVATSRRVLVPLVGAVALALALAAWRLLRKPSRRSARASPDRLLDAIAALDARYGGREAETPVEEWRRYETERARLKADAEAALAETALAARGQTSYT